MNSTSSEIIIIGGGMVGLSLAYELLNRKISKNIIVLDKEKELGMHTSGRNSGVLHAGIYYKPNSLKANVCIKGGNRLKKWIKERSLALNECGKIIIPTKKILDPQLDLLYTRGKKNGAFVELIDEKKLLELEPNSHSPSGRALWSPSTAVVNPKEIIMHLEKELKENGVIFLKNEIIERISLKDKQIHTTRNNCYEYKYFFNCAGLHSDKIAHMCNVGKEYSILPFKGLYWRLKNNNKYKIKTNIYPVPDLSVPFLGVHFTPNADLYPKIYIGPTATFAFGRENYKLFQSIEPLMSMTNLFTLSKQYLLNQNKFRNYVHDQSLQAFKPFFLIAAKKLVPALQSNEIEISDKSGIRSQLYNKKEQKLVEDFIYINSFDSTHILNAVSPAFTASFALADLIINSSNVINSL